MTTDRQSWLIPAVLALGTAAIYFPGLQNAPLFLNRDEVLSALTAHSVATTGRDLHGFVMPLFFQMTVANERSMWFEPVLMYAIVLAERLLPFSEATIRAPMVIAGVIDVVLVYFVARLLFVNRRFALAAAALLALTPAHFMFSRVAMDFQMPVPFILGWLLCLLLYFDRDDSRLLCAAGLLLGFGLYSYVAAVMMMPIYWVLSCLALWQRRERWQRYFVLTVGVLLPAVLCLPFLLRHPEVLHDVAVHYQTHDPNGSRTSAAVAPLITPARLAAMGRAYPTFWNPRFLFINGPSWVSESTWQAGVFLLPTAGLFLVGVARLVRRMVSDPRALLLLGGLITAPLPGTFVGEPEAIRRILELLPFVVIIAIYGLESLWTARTARDGYAAFLAMWVAVLAVAVAGHAYVPQAQAYVRAASAPLIVAGLALLLLRLPFDREALPTILISAGASVLTVQIGAAIGIQPLLVLAAVAVVALSVSSNVRLKSAYGAVTGGVLIGVVASAFLDVYVDYSARRIGAIPASAFVLALRAGMTVAVAAVSVALAMTAHRSATRASANAVACIGFGWVAFAYFHIDWLMNPPARAAYVAVVLVSIVAVAVVVNAALAESRRLPMITTVTVAVMACIQFTSFYIDYHGAFQARRSGEVEGNIRLALETAIQRADNRPVPLLYVERTRGELGGGELTGLGRLYATFYLLKARHDELIPRVAEASDLGAVDPDRMLNLAGGSIIVVTTSGATGMAVARMLDAGRLRVDAFVTAPDGTPIFWVLER